MGMIHDHIILDVPADTGADCPYPGLRPFSERDADHFFGREDEIGEIVSMLEDHQLVVIHGASGCGKSSIVRAGLIPLFRLDAMANSREARVVIVRPGDPRGPLQALAEKLDQILPIGKDDDSLPEGLTGGSWSSKLAASPNWQIDISAAATASCVVLCVVIDQFEEIFSAARTGYNAEAERLIQFLVSLGEGAARGTGLGERSLSVVVTMRSDYLGNCAIWEGFAETVNRSQYLLPRISTYGALRAIQEPARRWGGLVEEEVVDRLLAVIAREVDGLPILQHALMRAWRYADNRAGARTVDLSALERAGGADRALSSHAEEVVQSLVANDLLRESTINWIFRSLSDLDTDRRIIRRSISLQQLSAESGASIGEVRSIIEAFRKVEHSLVSPVAPEPLEDDSIVTVSHETLLRQWQRIADPSYVKGRPNGLVYLEFQDGMIWRFLVVGAQGFEQDRKNVLNPAATEQRIGWYREIEQRPGWIGRHMLVEGSGSADPVIQWFQVSKYLQASEESLYSSQLRNRKQKMVIAAAFSAFIVLISVIFIQNNENKNLQITSFIADQDRLKKSELNLIAELMIKTSYAQALKYCAETSGGVNDQVCVRKRSDYYFNKLKGKPLERGPSSTDLSLSPNVGSLGSVPN